MTEMLDLFPPSYEASRQRFIDSLPVIQQRWPTADLHNHPLRDYPDVSIDWITADATSANDKLLLFTTGEHGIEGYTGSAMLELFTQKYLPQLDPTNTALIIVHMIDPWGMQYLRRTNADNLDLNRTFVYDPKKFDPAFNPDYAQLDAFLAPQKPLPPFWWANLKFIFQSYYHFRKIGKADFFKTALLGQYAYPQSIHYGGETYPEEVSLTKSLFQQAFEKSQKILHLDMHTGYGPRYQMTLVNSPLEKRTSAEISAQSGYPLVAAMTPDEFYEVRGDMIDYVYMLRDTKFPDTDLYATSFEFGTFGDHISSRKRMLRAMIFENQVFHHGAANNQTAQKARQEFLEAFFPQEEKWQRKAIADGDQAFSGLLKMEGFIP